MKGAQLPDGLVVFVKRDCATCQMVEPLLGEIAATVFTQDDATFPSTVAAVDDTALAYSWHHRIETVPTLIRVHGGDEIERTEGWMAADWRRITGVADLGRSLPAMRPGCGSLSVDPSLVDELRVRFSGDTLRSRRIELADAEDEIEALYHRGVTDGLPVVPPTPARVLRMLTGTDRDPQAIVATVAPDLEPVTVEKVAVNAVMAGCLPEYLPWVLTAVEAVCTDEFNVHGVLCTTMPVGPVLVCNGPGTAAIGLNCGSNALGQGNRANMTVGRAVQLVIRNVGGGRPGRGGVDRATHGNPGKYGLCFAEREFDSPWTSLAASRGFDSTANTVTAFAGEGPRCVVDQKVRTAEQLATILATELLHVHTPKLAMAFDAMVVVGPEHARVFATAGWDRERVLAEIHRRSTRPGVEWMPGAGGIADGMPEFLADAPALPKFRPDGLLLVHAGGDAGLFSAIIGGWAGATMGSTPVTREVRG